ncbi:hypothetical protein FRZ06_13325 [Anoxybacterium hadale]|uniref:Uncharacterized protein n=1 Tax=Anoxybacterium hadale TaxID=3408580 RepID=A0ACD1ACN0_9FIRM|nr:hypothetical protein FRZ06_13325 [Clostridiales bacterium]
MPTVMDVVKPLPGILTFTYEDVNTMLNFQQLWIELVVWMRDYFKSTLENNPNQAAVENRLFGDLPMDFYTEFSKYFSPEISQQFLNLLTKMITINIDLVNGYKNNDDAALDASTKQWYQTADEMAAFLASINPYWNKEIISEFLDDYIKFKIQEIIAFLNGNYEMETRIFDDLENKAIELAAYMSTGMILMQRPPQYELPPESAASVQSRNSLGGDHNECTG